MVRTIPFVVAKVKRLRDDNSENTSTNSDSRTSAAATNIEGSSANRDIDSSSSNNLSYEDAVEQSAQAVIKAVKDLVTMSRSLEESGGGREGSSSSLSANYELDRVAKRMDAWMAQQVRKGEVVVKIRSGGEDWGMNEPLEGVRF